MINPVKFHKAYTTKTPRGDFPFKYQGGSKPYVTPLQMALAKGKNKNMANSRLDAYAFSNKKGYRDPSSKKPGGAIA